MSAPAVTVVVPALEAEPWIGAALESVLADPGPGLEVLVVEQGSRDRTRAIAAGFGPPVRVIDRPVRGVSGARNQAIREARGGILVFQDADDLSEPGRVRAAVEALGRDPAVGLVYGGARRIGPDGAPYTADGGPARIEAPPFDPARLCEENYLMLGAVAVRTALVREVGGFDETLSAMEDWDLWLRLAARTRFAPLPGLAYAYRVHPASASGTMDDATKTAARRALYRAGTAAALALPGIPWARRLGIVLRLARKRFGLWRRGLR